MADLSGVDDETVIAEAMSRLRARRGERAAEASRRNGKLGGNRVVSAETREKLRKARAGRPASEETKAKISAAIKARYESGWRAKDPDAGV